MATNDHERLLLRMWEDCNSERAALREALTALLAATDAFVGRYPVTESANAFWAARAAAAAVVEQAS